MLNSRGKIVILGAGLAGLSTALNLKTNYLIFEKESRPGGLCKSIYLKGFTFDYAGHLLHFRKNWTRNFLRKVLKNNFELRKRNSWIYSKNVYTKYPFQMNTYGLPVKVVQECLLGYFEAIYDQHRNLIPSDFGKWILTKFGSGIAKHFMIPYNKKLYKIDLKEMNTDWAERFIPMPNPDDVITGAITDQDKLVGYNVLFGYPKRGGIVALVRSMIACMRDNVNTDCMAVKIDCGKRLIYFRNGLVVPYSFLVSTIPLNELIKIIKNVPKAISSAARRLRYRSVYVLNLGIARKNVSDKHWIYFPESKYIFYRVGFPSNFSSYVVPKAASSLSVEVSFIKYSDKKFRGFRERILEDLIQAKILKNRNEITVTKEIYIKYAYVIYDHNRNDNIKIIRKHLERNNIFTAGRYGNWEYSTMEDALLQGKMMAKKIRFLCKIH